MIQVIRENIRKRKLLVILVACSLISFILGVLFISLLSDSNQELIKQSVGDYFVGISTEKISYLKDLYSVMTSNLIMGIFIWVIGISIIGILIVSGILFFKSFLVGFSFCSIIYTYGFKGVLIGFIYIFPEIINLFITFVLVYYSICFSVLLFNYLFRKKEYNKNVVVKRYLKLLVVVIGLLIVSSLISVFVIPNVLKIL